MRQKAHYVRLPLPTSDIAPYARLPAEPCTVLDLPVRVSPFGGPGEAVTVQPGDGCGSARTGRVSQPHRCAAFIRPDLRSPRYVSASSYAGPLLSDVRHSNPSHFSAASDAPLSCGPVMRRTTHDLSFDGSEPVSGTVLTTPFSASPLGSPATASPCRSLLGTTGGHPQSCATRPAVPPHDAQRPPASRDLVSALRPRASTTAATQSHADLPPRPPKPTPSISAAKYLLKGSPNSSQHEATQATPPAETARGKSRSLTSPASGLRDTAPKQHTVFSQHPSSTSQARQPAIAGILCRFLLTLPAHVP